MKLANLTQRKRLLYAGASVAAHIGLLAVVLASSRTEPTYHEIPISFKEAIVQDTPANAPGPDVDAAEEPGMPAVSTASASESPSGPAGRLGQPQPAAAPGSDLLALASTDFSSLRAKLMLPTPTPQPSHSNDEDCGGLAPADPRIHLTQGAIDRLVNQPNAGVERGRGWGGVQMGMGGGGGCK